MKQNSDIKSILDNEIANAIGSDDNGEISANRAKAMRYYKAEPRGDEVEGRSKVISTDVADAIEWLMPSIVKTFVSSDDVVRFDPENENDEDQAEQESDMVNYVVTKENNAFIVFNTWFRDALLQKNGTVKTYWEEPTEEREEYKDLTPDELSKLNEGDVEFIEANQSENGTFNVVLLREDKPGRVVVEPVPPEELLVNSDHTSIDLENARFVAHERMMPASDLIEMGIDKKVVDALAPYDYDGDEESYERNRHGYESESDAGDYSMRLIKVYECYIRVDTNDDGVAELRKYLYASKKILSDEEVDRIPFSSLTPILQGHQFQGISIFDRLEQIQDQKTAIWRQSLDNLYLQNNMRTIARVGQINMQSLLSPRVGGVILIKKNAGPIQDNIQPFVTPPLGDQAFQMMGYLDKVREERTGVGPNSMGQNHDMSNDTAHGIERLMTAGEQLTNLIIRTFAETGVKSMFLQVRELLMKHQDKEKVINLRGKWVPVNPCEWRKRMKTTVKVGLGTGDRIKQQGTLQRVLEMQEKLKLGGMDGKLITDKKIFNALDDYVKSGGFNEAEPYFLNPESEEAMKIAQAQEGKPQEPPFEQQILMIQAQAEKKKAENEERKTQLEIQKFEVDILEKQEKVKKAERDSIKGFQETTIKASEAEKKNELESKKLKADTMLSLRKLELEERDLEMGYEKQVQDFDLKLTDKLTPIIESMTTVQETISKPKQVERDEQGNIISINGSPIVRDEQGNITQIG